MAHAQDNQSGNGVAALEAALGALKGENVQFLQAVDKLLVAALRSDVLEASVVEGSKVLVKLGNDVSKIIELPHGVSTFRAILARVGTICDSAAKKSSFVGKARALLVRAGVVADNTLTERRSQEIKYLSASIRGQAGSPLYSLDGVLLVEDRGGEEARLHIVMENTGKGQRLTITRAQ
jgi:hypothetical protein